MASEAEQAVQKALVTHLAAIKGELTEIKKAVAASQALGGVYQAFRLAFFRGQKEPLAIPNVDFLIFSLLTNDIKFVGFDVAQKRLLLAKDGVTFATDAYFYVALEIFAKEEYRILRTLVNRPFVVYDLGMNRGYASLWFASQPQCRAVYGFELLDSPYQWALANFALNPQLADKIKPFCTGLSNENKTVELHYEDASDGVSTVMPEFYSAYWTEQRKSQVLKKSVPLRKASEVLAALPPVNPDEMRVLKIDVEGAEYDIVAELAQAGRLDFDIILAETHLGLEKFLALVPDHRPVEIIRHSDTMANIALVRSSPR